MKISEHRNSESKFTAKKILEFECKNTVLICSLIFDNKEFYSLRFYWC